MKTQPTRQMDARARRFVVALGAGLVGVVASVLAARGGNPMLGVGAAQILLLLVGALLSTFVFHEQTRRWVPWIGVGVLAFAVGLSWTGAIWNWFQFEPLTHPGSNPLYGRRSLLYQLFEGLFAPLWGLLVVGAMLLAAPSPSRNRLRATAVILGVAYVFLAVQLASVYRSWRALPESYEWGVGLWATLIVTALTLPLLIAFVRALRGRRRDETARSSAAALSR